MEQEGWEELGEGEYEMIVRGTSVLFGMSTNATYSISVSPPLSPIASRDHNPTSAHIITRQTNNNTCNPFLWDNSPLSLYGIQTFPSGSTVLPPSLRTTPLIITAKALSPCEEVGMSKDILPPSVLTWRFLDPVPEGLDGVEIDDWVVGTQLIVPVLFLEDRNAFPVNEPVGIFFFFSL